MDKQTIANLGTALNLLGGITSISYIEIVESTADSATPLYSKLFTEGFTPEPFQNIAAMENITKGASEGNPISFQKNSDNGKTIFFCVIPLCLKEKSVYCVAQSSSEIFETDLAIVSLSGKLIAAQGKCLFNEKNETDSRYKEELMKMRNAQARLFPKFENIDGLDISAVYLPSDLMTGTFIDAFHLNKETYQIVTCDIIGNDPSSSFAGAAVRTLVRSYSSASTMPSALIELIDNRMSKIVSGIHSLLFLSVYQINQRSGKSVISSYGDINTVFYSKKKKGYIHVNTTQTGLNLAKKIVFKDISLILEPGDSLLFYTKGVKNATSEDGSQIYGEDRIIQNFKSNIESPPLEIIHSMTETIYEFTNYSNPADDIILMCIRKK
ncbi:MAG TPA: SpoIIE family protein phosphatase [Spirochaetota bacterium]|nr:SpoIIE family protein phosphatase [Spirochaetota bacterium]HPI87798.1 SpoIIE family protein phosphatase [Spirochaetota bacterium]HPR47026.1 SpoIIE family protein phosphatase [Spirochaetota bacterium]